MPVSESHAIKDDIFHFIPGSQENGLSDMDYERYFLMTVTDKLWQ